MPTAKKRVSVTVTDQMSRNLEVLWLFHPTMKGQTLESIQMLATLGATYLLSRETKTPATAVPVPEQNVDGQATEEVTVEEDPKTMPDLEEPLQSPKFQSSEPIQQAGTLESEGVSIENDEIEEWTD